MSSIADIKLLGWVIDKLLSYSDKQKVRVNEAIASIQEAWLCTFDYLKNQNGEYTPSQELSKLWNIAAMKTRLIDQELGNKLQNKSRFWIHPDLPRQSRILLLTEIQDELERLNKKF
ncbi:hypothetical protein [uncultured Tenacibaculum sp.]|uniref:hypothetical protein n=1 Tax=uncultured Tenacibaculum sp. TaxID=174713 RepID=UPI0026086BE0|nr:hypothetical protein [uncultured Tenacibaculum sp.]